LAALNTNMLGALAFARALLPDMRQAGYGRIVNVTSFTVREPYPNMGLATGVRAGLTGAMKSLSHEVGPEGITVNNLLPGLMDTGALERVYNAQAKAKGIAPEEAKAAMAEGVPLRRLGRAEDFGPMCAFLCSVHAAYITGQNITIDGGLSKPLL
jgi:3-oxoacyl-[acyl-carrier protein] reductase